MFDRFKTTQEEDYFEEIDLFSQIIYLANQIDHAGSPPILTYTNSKEDRDRALGYAKASLSVLRKLTKEPIPVPYSSGFVNKIIEENKKLKEDFPEYEIITELYSQLHEKDLIIEELAKSFKETSYQMEKRIRELEHVVDMVDCSKSRIIRIEQENAFLKQLMKDHEKMLREGKPYESVFSKDVVEKLKKGENV